MQITLIRHLPTDWNKKNIYQGRRDISISPVTNEIDQAIISNRELLKKLEPFDIVLASTLNRTHQTAMLYGYPVESEGLLDELDFGSFEGLPKEELIKASDNKWIENPIELVLGESVNNFGQRIVNFLDKYQECNKILVFGHGSWIRAIVSLAKYGHINNMNKMAVGNNELVTISLNNGKSQVELEG